MRHTYFGKKLSRTHDARRQLLRNLICDLITYGSIKTTKAKAVAIRSKVEKLITRAKKGTQAAYRLTLAEIGNSKVTKQLMEDAKTRFSPRNSGYIRILRFGLMGSDARDMVQISFVDPRIVQDVIGPKEKVKEKKQTGKTEEKKAEVKGKKETKGKKEKKIKKVTKK
jgi:large subunit ribosomal protein L17